MRVNGKSSRFGQSSDFITREAATFSTCFTKEKQSAEVTLTAPPSLTAFFYKRIAVYSQKLLVFCVSLVCRALWLLYKRRLCWQEPHSEVEEAGLWKSVLSSLHSDKRHQLRHQLHMPSAQRQAGSGTVVFKLNHIVKSSWASDHRTHLCFVHKLLPHIWEWKIV